MGLTIHWTFRFGGGTTEARRLVRALRERALVLPFDEVTDLYEIDAPDGEPDAPPPLHDALRLGASMPVAPPGGNGGSPLLVPPRHAILFSARAAGAESALFGLATRPATVPDGRGADVPTGLGAGWSFASWCKTQYAGLPAHGGPTHFVRAHSAIVAVLDRARDLGAGVDVQDDSGYFEHRDRSRLLQELDRHNILVAAIAGGLKDAFGHFPTRVVCPIATHPDFEDFEARGRRRTRTPPARLL